jgi:hypothetical protein
LKIRNIFGRRHPSGWRRLCDTGVEFPPDVHALLTSQFHDGYHNNVEQSRYEIVQTLGSFQIPIKSELAHLYLNYGPYCVRGHYELNEIDNWASATDYAHDELGVDASFIALTSIEGGGITLYNRANGKVFDVEFGQFDCLAEGKLTPIAETVSNFIRWCAKIDVEEHGIIEDL